MSTMGFGASGTRGCVVAFVGVVHFFPFSHSITIAQYLETAIDDVPFWLLYQWANKILKNETGGMDFNWSTGRFHIKSRTPRTNFVQMSYSLRPLRPDKILIKD